MNLRRMNDQGVDRFSKFLDSLTSATPLPYPKTLLDDPEATVEVTPSIEVEQRTFDTRLAAAKYLFHLFKKSGQTDIERDRGLWAWLSLFYFEQLCPMRGTGRVIRERARYFPDLTNFQRYYRHPLAGSYLIYSAHQDDPSRVLAFLSVPLHIMTDIIEQLASRQELVTNSGLVSVATKLYYDREKSDLRPGARGKGKGTARRLADVMNQFDVTWDLYSMKQHEIESLLPDEFSRFLKTV